MSIIYNVTNKVDGRVADTWLKWMISEHIPEVMSTNCFYHFRIVHLLEVDESEGPTYAIQYTAESKADYNRFIEKYAADLRNKAYEKWGEKFIAFASVMAVVQ